MSERIFAVVAAVALGMACNAVPAVSQGPTPTPVPTEGPATVLSPAWYIAGSVSDPDGPLTGRQIGEPPPPGAPRRTPPPRPASYPPVCAKSVVCEMDGSVDGGVTDGAGGLRVTWKQTAQSYTFAYPFDLPPGGGNVSGVGVDSKDNVWVYQRNKAPNPALFKFGPDHKLLFAVPSSIADDSEPFRAHGMNVDAEDNVWICNEFGDTVTKISPEGKLLMTLGVKGKRGDWDEAKGQRLLWEPTQIDFGPNGDIYIFESHGDESPNDFGSDDPTNHIGSARVLHLDKNAKFINQWYGAQHGRGKFNNTHGSAVDPVTGDVWVGDRMDYRIVIFNANGHYLRTIAMQNLVCALFFDHHPGPQFGRLWLGTGMDGQVVSLDRAGNVLFAMGNRAGTKPGQFGEATYMGSDSHGNLYVGDTVYTRATELIPPVKKEMASGQ
jgi:hypothetical protein